METKIDKIIKWENWAGRGQRVGTHRLISCEIIRCICTKERKKEGNGSYKKRPNEKNKSEKYYNNSEILTGSMALRDDRG